MYAIPWVHGSIVTHDELPRRYAEIVPDPWVFRKEKRQRQWQSVGAVSDPMLQC